MKINFLQIIMAYLDPNKYTPKIYGAYIKIYTNLNNNI